ncbi:hypothetical protein J2S08_003015 [Bacillus chungangensis]|uniref:Uncharacterized protein n=1 Tax=Bacillus chungangensis TaxID=587633 RepID=A0ABT9WVD3_9BACI|nr:hypothetical protein [Bacillus chungangensis]
MIRVYLRALQSNFFLIATQILPQESLNEARDAVKNLDSCTSSLKPTNYKQAKLYLYVVYGERNFYK